MCMIYKMGLQSFSVDKIKGSQISRNILWLTIIFIINKDGYFNITPMAKCRSHQMGILEKHLREIKWRIKPGRREKLFTRIYHFKFELKLTLFHHPIMLQFHLNPISLSISLFASCFVYLVICFPFFSFFWSNWG